MKLKKKNIIISICLIMLSVIYTILVKYVDVAPIGPKASSVGFSTLNKFVFNFLGRSNIWYNITEVLGMISILIALFYALIGLYKLIKNKSILKIDKEIIILGIFYFVVLLVYLFFEKVIINYRPVLVKGVLEASYPSSHTMLSICICLSAIIINNKLYKSMRISKIINTLSIIIMITTTVGRLLSGMHWVSDILGGIIISICLSYIFKTVIYSLNEEES